MLGEQAMCEHFGIYQSSELSRFRHSKRKYRICPLCGYHNTITNEKACDKTLLLVEYDELPPTVVQAEGSAPTPPPPCPGGHGSFGPGGHYSGPCLCSPGGCPRANSHATCWPNALYNGNSIGINMANPQLALVAEEHIVGWKPGREWFVGQRVMVTSAAANESFNDSLLQPEQKSTAGGPALWQGGRLGGMATVRAWKRCGGASMTHSWHGNRVLHRIPWKVEEEDTMVLLLQHEGSTGLDLSFATHIFLLERIHDPALRNQIISRAHRVGANGPVLVTLLQVVAEGEENNYY